MIIKSSTHSIIATIPNDPNSPSITPNPYILGFIAYEKAK